MRVRHAQGICSSTGSHTHMSHTHTHTHTRTHTLDIHLYCCPSLEAAPVSPRGRASSSLLEARGGGARGRLFKCCPCSPSALLFFHTGETWLGTSCKHTV